MAYTPEEKADALTLAADVGPAEAALSLGIPADTIRKWRREEGAPMDTAIDQQDATPNRSQGSGKGQGKRKTGGKRQSLKQPLTDALTSLGVAVQLVNGYDGARIVAGAPQLAEALDELAKQDAAVHRALQRILTGSSWGGVVIAAMSIAVPIAANHQLIPPHTAAILGAPMPPAADGSGNDQAPNMADLVSMASFQPTGEPADGEADPTPPEPGTEHE